MNKTDAKNLLRRRQELLQTHNRLNMNIDDAETWIKEDYEDTRNDISVVLQKMDRKLLQYVKKSTVGKWLLQIKGITVDMAAALITHFDVTGKECAAQFLNFAGLNDFNEDHDKEMSLLMRKIRNSFRDTKDGYYINISKEKYTEHIKNNVNPITAKNRADGHMMRLFIAHLFEEMYREEHDGKLPKRHTDFTKAVIPPEVPYTK